MFSSSSNLAVLINYHLNWKIKHFTNLLTTSKSQTVSLARTVMVGIELQKKSGCLLKAQTSCFGPAWQNAT